MTVQKRYRLRIADVVMVPEHVPEAARATAREHGGAWVADCVGDPPEVVLSLDPAEARLFDTEQEAFAFTRLSGMRALALVCEALRKDEDA